MKSFENFPDGILVQEYAPCRMLSVLATPSKRPRQYQRATYSCWKSPAFGGAGTNVSLGYGSLILEQPLSRGGGHALKDFETPSGKGAGDENFPVGSWLLSAEHRPHVMAFYNFVRAADDIADNSGLDAEEKLQRLNLFEQALLGDEQHLAALPKANALRQSLSRTGVTDRHALGLLKAFKQDATKNRYVDWADLMDYCAHSASPVGRFLLDLHGEDKALYRLSDPLCDALQILNHLQDCQDDFRQLDRVYLPLDLLANAGIDETALVASAASPALRQVLDAVLDDTDDLLQQASDLPAALISRRLGAESAVILEIAKQLSYQLRRRDPLSERVELSKPAFASSAIKGLGRLQWLKRGRRQSLPAGTGAMR